MRIEALSENRISDFIEYCIKYCPEQDESFIPRTDYKPGRDEVTYILLNGDNKITGAASLMIKRDCKDGRFRIFHCVERSVENYRSLLDLSLKHTGQLDNIFCFITEDKSEVRKIWEELGFRIKRYSFVMERELDSTVDFSLPENFSVRKMNGEDEEQAYCDIINSAFAGIAGHTHFTIGNITEMKKDISHFDGGFNILWENDKPAGIVKLLKTNENGVETLFIDSLGVHTSYQGMGLGRSLLRYAINRGIDMGLKQTMLTVNAENSKAANLYLKEGFKKTEVYICYNKKLT